MTTHEMIAEILNSPAPVFSQWRRWSPAGRPVLIEAMLFGATKTKRRRVSLFPGTRGERENWGSHDDIEVPPIPVAVELDGALLVVVDPAACGSEAELHRTEVDNLDFALRDELKTEEVKRVKRRPTSKSVDEKSELEGERTHDSDGDLEGDDRAWRVGDDVELCWTEEADKKGASERGTNWRRSATGWAKENGGGDGSQLTCSVLPSTRFPRRGRGSHSQVGPPSWSRWGRVSPAFR